MTKLSVNINKIATLRNSRGHNVPNVQQVAIDCERFGADGITVHPRPDERHIRYRDVHELKPILKTELNIEGNPKEKKFMDLVLDIRPAQVTLVPDQQNQLTSDHGWDTIKEFDYLKETIAVFKSAGIRTSVFVDPRVNWIEAASKTGTDRVELYTEAYAAAFSTSPSAAIQQYVVAAKRAHESGLGLNAGHDLNLQNLAYLKQHIPYILEVSIGHALIADALYFGLENTIQLYKRKLV